MGKHNRKITATKQGDRQGVQHEEHIDDNLLPDAIEIEKLHAMDPDIIPWLKTRAEVEQSFRHNAYTNRLEKINQQDKREHHTARYGLTIYGLLVIACILASYFLVRDNHNLSGTIFGGTAVILAFAVLIGRVGKRQENQK